MFSSKAAANQLFSELHLDNLPLKKKQKILSKVVDHFNKVVILTVLGRLTDAQFEDFKKAANSENADAQILIFAGQIPGLYEAIEYKLTTEYKIMKAALN